MKYGLSIPLGACSTAEDVWSNLPFDYGVMSAGCGTGEYLFDSKYARDMAEKKLKEVITSTFERED